MEADKCIARVLYGATDMNLPEIFETMDIAEEAAFPADQHLIARSLSRVASDTSNPELQAAAFAILRNSTVYAEYEKYGEYYEDGEQCFDGEECINSGIRVNLNDAIADFYDSYDAVMSGNRIDGTISFEVCEYMRDEQTGELSELGNYMENDKAYAVNAAEYSRQYRDMAAEYEKAVRTDYEASKNMLSLDTYMGHAKLSINEFYDYVESDKRLSGLQDKFNQDMENALMAGENGIAVMDATQPGYNGILTNADLDASATNSGLEIMRFGIKEAPDGSTIGTITMSASDRVLQDMIVKNILQGDRINLVSNDGKLTDAVTDAVNRGDFKDLTDASLPNDGSPTVRIENPRENVDLTITFRNIEGQDLVDFYSDISSIAAEYQNTEWSECAYENAMYDAVHTQENGQDFDSQEEDLEL